MKENSPEQSPPSPKLKKKPSLIRDNFENISKLGRGAYGNVFLVRKGKQQYALKQIQKRKLGREEKQYQALIERELLTKIDHPGIIKLHSSFQDRDCLYFVLQYCEGGSFTSFITLHHKQINHHIKKFYIAQIVAILQYLHNKGITHRDLKPENILLSKYGHIKIIDFGTAEISDCLLLTEEFKERVLKMKKKCDEEQQAQKSQHMPALQLKRMESEQAFSPTKSRQRKSTFVGTANYMSPQLIQHNLCYMSADLWALGCIIYQIFYLQPPFVDLTQFGVYEKIKRGQVKFPKNQYITESAIDLIKQLLVRDPDQRLGCGYNQNLTFQKLKDHPFFEGIDFETIFQQPVPDYQDKPMKPQQLQFHQELYEKYKAQMAQKFKSRIKQKQDVLIQGVIEKKTFVTYSFYYLIVYNDLSVRKIKIQNDQVKEMDILYKYFFNENSKAKQPMPPAKIIAGNKFQLVTTEQTLTIRSQSNEEAERWVKAIDERAVQLRSQWMKDSSDSD